MPVKHRSSDRSSSPVVRSIPDSVLWGLVGTVVLSALGQGLVMWNQVTRLSDSLSRLETQNQGVSQKLDEITRTNSTAAQKDSTHDAQILSLQNRMTQLEGMFPRTVPSQLMPTSPGR